MIEYEGPSLVQHLKEQAATEEKLQQDIEDYVRQMAEKDQAGCAFWACEGPDEKPVGMKTCHHCWSVWDARQLLARIEGEA